MPDRPVTPEQTIQRPSDEEERRALVWLMDQRMHGGPLERRYAASVIDTLAWFEDRLARERPGD